MGKDLNPRRPGAHSARLRHSASVIAATIMLGGQAFAQEAPSSPAEPAPASLASPASGAESSAEQPAADTIVVTGSRLANKGFSAPTPVTVIGAADISRQGATSINEVLNQLPAFRATTSPITAALYANNIGASTADLRALGAARTLVLIDGRRVVPETVQGATVPGGAVDLNIIPTALIQRTEVVTGGASAAYGSDAVAGVVNILLDTKFEGFRGNLQYGQTDIGDSKSYSGSAGFGTKLGERGHLVVGIDYSNDRGTGDCYTRDWCLPGRNQVNNPTHVNGLPAILLLPETSFATATRNGIITAGPLAGQEFAPDGQSTYRHNYGTYFGSGLFQSTGGDGRHPYFENTPLEAPVRRYATMAHLDWELSDSIKSFVELSYANVHGSTIGAQTRDASAFTIQKDNAYLPASVVAAMTAANVTTFTFGRIGDDLGATLDYNKRSTFRGVGGLEGRFGGSWKWNAYYQYGRTNYHQRQDNTRINDNFTRAVDAVRLGNGSVVCRVNADTITTNDDPACAPLDLFGENHFSAAAKAYSFGTAIQDTRMTQQVAAGSMSGNLFDLWAGPLSIAFGGEYRRDSVHSTTDPISAALRFYTGSGTALDGRINVKEGFVEAGLPLAKDLPFAHTLDLNGAVRATDYSTSGTVWSWKAGATWEPVRQLRFRVTRSRDIRAPNIYELFGAQTSGYTSINDPQKGGATGLAFTLSGGNPKLVPEIANTFTAGAVLQPDFWGLNRLRFSADFYDIKLAKAITTLGGQPILDLCARGNAALCAQVSRDAAGNILSISNTNLNLNRLNTRGIDFELSYSQPLSELSPRLGGTLSLRVLATKIFSLTTIDTAGNKVNRVGQLGPVISAATGGVPYWQGTMFMTYAKGPFSGTLQFRYVSSGRRDNTLIGPDDPRYNPLLPNSVNINHVPSYTYMNANLSYAIVDDGRRRVELFAVVNNLFDTAPPNYMPFFTPTNPILYDVLGRAYRGGVRVSF